MCVLYLIWSLGESSACMAQGDDYTRTHIKCMKVKLALTPSAWLLPKPLYQRLEKRSCRLRVCWDCTGAIFPLVLTGIVLGWMDDGFQAVFTRPPVISLLCFDRLRQPDRYRPVRLHNICRTFQFVTIRSPRLAFCLRLCPSLPLWAVWLSIRPSVCQSEFRRLGERQ